jgi:hypothetical protein
MATLKLLSGLKGIDGVTVSHELEVDYSSLDELVDAMAVEIVDNVSHGRSADGLTALPALTDAAKRTRKQRGQDADAPRGGTSETVKSIKAHKTVLSSALGTQPAWIIAAEESDPGKLERILGGSPFDASVTSSKYKANEQKAADGLVKAK